MSVLRDNRWTSKGLAAIEGSQNISDGAFVIDGYNRIHVIYSGTGQGIQSTWTRGGTFCPARRVRIGLGAG